MSVYSQDIIDRFWAKVDVCGPDECWLWTGAVKGGGYGSFWVEGRVYLNAHQASFIIAHGRAPSGVTRHTCDVKRCVNPAHLLEGTPRQNVLDAKAKGHIPSGDDHWRRRHPEWASPAPVRLGSRVPVSKLTEDDIPAIRLRAAKGERHLDIARSYGVTRGCISQVVRRSTWGHV